MKKLTCIAAILLCVVFFISGCSNNESQSASTQLPGGGSQSPSASAASGQQSSEQQQQTGGQMIEPKQLISKVEAAQLLGETVKDESSEEQPMLGMKICFYAAENNASKSYLQIAVVQSGAFQQQGQSGGSSGQSGSSGGSGQSGASSPSGSPGSSSDSGQNGGSGGSQSQNSQLTTKGIFEALKKAMENLNSTDTGRIGDDNFMSAQGMGILSGEYYIYVSAGSNDATQIEQIVKKAGELAVNNLKRIMGK